MDKLLKSIDTIEAIEEASKDLNLLRDIANKRRMYFETTGVRLKSWLLNDSILLDFNGYIYHLSNFENNEDGDNIIEVEPTMVSGVLQGYLSLPFKGTICPVCNKEITLEDVYNANFVTFDEHVTHKCECESNYKKISKSINLVKDVYFILTRVYGGVDIEKIVMGKEEINIEATVSYPYMRDAIFKFTAKISKEGFMLLRIVVTKEKQIYDITSWDYQYTPCYSNVEIEGKLLALKERIRVITPVYI